MAIEKMDTRTSKMMCELLESLHRAVIITPNQMRAGFLRVSIGYGSRNLEGGLRVNFTVTIKLYHSIYHDVR